jgi:hypothetical protein
VRGGGAVVVGKPLKEDLDGVDDVWMSFLRRVTPVFAVLSIAVAGCGGDKGDKSPPSAAVTTTVAPAAVAGVDDLTTLIVTAPPAAGYSEITGVFGPFDLQGYLDNFSDTPDADRAMLTATGFVRGDARGWVDPPTTNALVIFVFEFRDGAGAESARHDILEQARLLKDGRGFDVPGIQGAEGQTYVENTDSGPETVDLVALVRANRLFMVAAQSPDPSLGRSLAVDLAKDEAALLG